LPTKRFKIEFLDDHGIKHTLSLEGNVPKEKISQILDYVELMGGTQPVANNIDLSKKDSRFEKIKKVIISQYQDKIFTSKNVQGSFRELLGEDVPHSTISTYLSRLVDKGFLNRGGSSGEWHYALSPRREVSYF